MANQPNKPQAAAPVGPVTVAKETAVFKERGDIKPVRVNELKPPKHNDSVHGVSRERR